MTFVKHSQFLGAFAKLRKATISFVMSVRPSFCPHGTTRLPMDEFPLNFIFVYFLKTVEKSQVSLKSDKINGYFTWGTLDLFFSYLAHFFLEREMLQIKVVEKIKRKKHILCSLKFFFRKSCVLWDNVEIVSWGGAVHEWRMRTACWIPQSKIKHSGFLTLFFLLQQWLKNTPHGYVTRTLPLFFYRIPYNSSEEKSRIGWKMLCNFILGSTTGGHTLTISVTKPVALLNGICQLIMKNIPAVHRLYILSALFNAEYNQLQYGGEFCD
jgi:hypothetical protein